MLAIILLDRTALSPSKRTEAGHTRSAYKGKDEQPSTPMNSYWSASGGGDDR